MCAIYLGNNRSSSRRIFFHFFNEIKAAEGQRLLLHHILSAAK